MDVCGIFFMVLYTKCIFLPVAPEDGLRVSVMSRHTLADGKTPDPRITSSSFDRKMTSLAPPDKLVGAYYRGEVSWEEYAKQYEDHLHIPDNRLFLSNIARQALIQDITLLCVEDTPDKCHRRLLAEEFKRLEEKLVVVHR